MHLRSIPRKSIHVQVLVGPKANWTSNACRHDPDPGRTSTISSHARLLRMSLPARDRSPQRDGQAQSRKTVLLSFQHFPSDEILITQHLACPKHNLDSPSCNLLPRLPHPRKSKSREVLPRGPMVYRASFVPSMVQKKLMTCNACREVVILRL
jgi:hypothetical protein